MKKADVLSPTFVTIIALAVAAIVLFGASGAFGSMTKKVIKTNNCQWSFALNAVTKTPPECEAVYSTLTKQDLSKGTTKAAKRIEEWHNKVEELTEKEKKGQELSYSEELIKSGYSQALEYFEYQEEYTADDLQLYEYAMDEYIAKSMKSCWTKVWKGKPPIFNEWWDRYDLKFFTLGEDIDPPKTLRGDKEWSSFIADKYGPPVFCVLCERIKFDEDVKELFRNSDKGTTISSLSAWMDNNPVIPKGSLPEDLDFFDNTPFSEFIQDDVHKGIFRHKFEYNVEDSLAILYSRINVYEPEQWKQSAFERIGWYTDEDIKEPVNVIAPIPYTEIGQRCHVLIS